MSPNLRLPALGRFFKNYCQRQHLAYIVATRLERMNMSGFMRHLRTEVGMSQRVINQI